MHTCWTVILDLTTEHHPPTDYAFILKTVSSLNHLVLLNVFDVSGYFLPSLFYTPLHLL